MILLMGRTKGITVITTAKRTVPGFEQMYRQLQQKVELGGLSASTLENYGRCIAKIALHFKALPTELEEIQINGYLQNLSHGPAPSISYFKHTVYGLRFLFRVFDLNDKAIRLPSLKRSDRMSLTYARQENWFGSNRFNQPEDHHGLIPPQIPPSGELAHASISRAIAKTIKLAS